MHFPVLIQDLAIVLGVDVGCLLIGKAFMLRKLVVGIYLLSVSSQGLAVYDPADVPWFATLQKEKIFIFHVCGSAR